MKYALVGTGRMGEAVEVVGAARLRVDLWSGPVQGSAEETRPACSIGIARDPYPDS